jgi:hypothetical protein
MAGRLRGLRGEPVCRYERQKSWKSRHHGRELDGRHVAGVGWLAIPKRFVGISLAADR